MIVAHHLVEGLAPVIVAAATSGPLLLVAVRARLGGRADASARFGRAAARE